MTRKPAPRKSTVDDPPGSAITTGKTDSTGKIVIKTASTMNLLQTAIIEYEVAKDDTDSIWLRLSGYEGKGYYRKTWVSLDTILQSLEAFAAKHPLVSLALKDVYPANTSCNSWSFLMAVLLAERLVERLENNKRHFQLCDPAPFLTSIEKLKATHSKPAKAKPKAKAKAAARMPKGKAKPATGK